VAENIRKQGRVKGSVPFFFMARRDSSATEEDEGLWEIVKLVYM
jgi:hypothetical protein